MNIFVVHTNPELAARQLCNKHVVKMTLETAQMLCSAVHVLSEDGKLDIDHADINDIRYHLISPPSDISDIS